MTKPEANPATIREASQVRGEWKRPHVEMFTKAGEIALTAHDTLPGELPYVSDAMNEQAWQSDVSEA